MTAPHYSDDNVTVYAGDCLDVLQMLGDSSIDAVITDPPYGLDFMGKHWDTGAVAFKGEVWEQCRRILKPGGHLAAFGGTRTWHRLAVAVEDAGFEIRDNLAWLYGSGFPKSHNLPDGRGTALKPAFEPIVLARKPLRGTVAANVVKHGTGALNIDACRVPTTDDLNGGGYSGGTPKTMFSGLGRLQPDQFVPPAGRWPSNVVLDPYAADELDQQSGVQRDGVAVRHRGVSNAVAYGGNIGRLPEGTPDMGYGGEGGASRFFPVFKYTAKAPGTERPTVNGVTHPTVKPLELMRWLVRLLTPPGGVVLDPFAGSGTTAEACIHEHKHAIVIEREPDYLPLILARLSKPMEIGFDFGEAS